MPSIPTNLYRLTTQTGAAMNLMRLLLLFLVGLMARRIYRAVKGAGQKRRRPPRENVETPGGGQADSGFTDLTEQGIDDADFEEIP